MAPCKHLDYAEGKYGPDIELRDCAPHFPEVRFWMPWLFSGRMFTMHFPRRITLS